MEDRRDRSGEPARAPIGLADTQPISDDPRASPPVAAGSAPTAPTTEAMAVGAGARVGRYVIVECIGAGGMGVVYRARDPDLGRLVALKLVPLRGAAGEQARARLLREAQALARVAHPNVIAVHDVGTSGDDVFIAMELVEGPTLTAWLRTPRAPAEIIAVFTAAGRGLGAAHRAGLVHRDFKPDNVIVADDGRVRVLDFGLARAAASAEPLSGPALAGAAPAAGSTQAGTVMGTLPYMSPEQIAGGAIDDRSDQFSFCVALHEALCGERPWAVPELRALAAGDTPPAPEARRIALSPHGRAALERGLSLRAADRFATMDELVAALTTTPRPKRWWLAAAAGMAVLAGAGVVIAVAAGRGGRDAAGSAAAIVVPCPGERDRLAGAWDEAVAARVRTRFVASGAPAAADTYERTAAEIDRWADGWVQARVAACRATRVDQVQSEQALTARLRCLDRRRVALAALTRLLGDADADVVKNAFAAAAGLPDLGRCADAHALPASDADDGAAVAAVRERLATAEASERVGRMRESVDLATAVTADARKLGNTQLLAAALYQLGYSQDHAGDPAAGIATLREAGRVAGEARDDWLAAEIWTDLIHVLGRTGRYDEAEALRPAAEAAVARTGGHALLAGKLANNLGALANAQGRTEEAIEHYRRALALNERGHGADSIEVGISLANLGGALTNHGEHDEALRMQERALALKRQHLGERHPSVARTLSHLGDIHYQRRRLAEARARYQEALAIHEAAVGQEHPSVPPVLLDLGHIASDERRFDEALALYRRALAIYDKTLGPDHPGRGYAITGIGNVHLAERRFAEARAEHERALALWQKAHPEHPVIAVALYNIGQVLRRQGRAAAALPFYRRALAHWEPRVPADHPELAMGLTGLAAVLVASGDARAALPLAERALQIRTAPGRPAVDRAESELVLAQARWALGTDRTEARRQAEAARAVLADAADPRLVDADTWLRAHPR